jgi:parallel beta-helix repeat protein
MKRSIILTLLIVVSNAAMAATLMVPSQYATIQNAINASSNGDTILVSPGTYRYEVGIRIIGKSVHIVSEGGPKVTSIANYSAPPEGESGSYAFDIESTPGPLTISGFTMWGHSEGDMGANDFTIMVENSNAKITGNIFFGNQPYRVIEVAGSSSPIIEYNLFYANNATSIDIGDGASPTIENNTFSGNVFYEDIRISGSNCHPIIRNNVIVNHARYCSPPGPYCYSYGVYASSPPGNIVFECNDVWNNGDANYGGTLADQTATNGNISADPLFCGALGSGNFYLQSGSPCAEQNAPSACSGQRMGCYPTKCTVGVKEQSWGSIKSGLDDKKK